MKHKTVWSVVSTALACTMVVSALTACGGKNPGDDEETKYTVTYVGGDMGGGTAPTGGEYAEGETFTLAQNTFTSDTHTFTGWNDGTADFGAGATYTMPAKNVTFTAQWEENGDTEAPVIAFATGKQDSYTTTAGTPVTLPSATATDAVDGEVELDVTVTSKGATLTKVADGYTFASDTAGEYDVSYYAVDSSDNEVEEFISVTVNPIKAETELEAGQNNLSNLAQSEVTFVENFEKGYDSPLARGFDFSQATGKPNASIVADENSIAGNSLIIDYTTCAWNTNTQFWFGSLDNYLRSGKWTISMDVKVLGGTAPSGLFFSFIYDGDNDGQNQEIRLGAVGETTTLTFEGIKNLDDTKTWHFRIFFYTGSSTYKYDDFRIAIDNITISVKEVVNAVVDRTGTPKELTGTDLDGNGYTLTGADDNYTALSGSMLYLEKSKVVAGDYLTAEQAANLTAENGFNSDYVILASTEICTFNSLNGLCTDSGYEYTITMSLYAPNAQNWYFFIVDGAGQQAHAASFSVNGALKKTFTITGADNYQRIGLYRQGIESLYIGDITISREERNTEVSPNGYKVGQTWTKSASEINLGNRGTSVVCSNVNLTGGGTLADYDGFENNAIHFNPNTTNVTMECFRGNNTLENGCTYKITANLYIVSLTGRLTFNFDNAVFPDIVSGKTGYQKVEITWKATKNVDFFSFFLPEGSTGEFYCSSITYELTALA